MTYLCASILSLHFDISGKRRVLPRYGSNLIYLCRSQRVPVLQVTEMD